MAKEAVADDTFERLMTMLQQETTSTDRKLAILFEFRGFFSAYQVSRILYTFSAPVDKIRAIQTLEPKLCRMTCSEARDIIGAVSIHNDKLKVLDSLKRYLVDFQTRAGREYITSSYIYEPDKFRAMGILNTVRSDVADMVPAGGHQGYAALGGLYIQAAPLNQHIYGDIHSQLMNLPGHGQVNLPALARAAQLPSMYRGHPSYAYPQGRDYAEDRNYPCHDRYIESAMARRFPSSMQYTQGI